MLSFPAACKDLPHSQKAAHILYIPVPFRYNGQEPHRQELPHFRFPPLYPPSSQALKAPYQAAPPPYNMCIRPLPSLSRRFHPD